MNSVNVVVLLGHITRNPRLSHTSSGKAVCDFGLALNRRWLDVNGDSHQETAFVEGLAVRVDRLTGELGEGELRELTKLFALGRREFETTHNGGGGRR